MEKTVERCRIGFLVETQNVSIISNPGRLYGIVVDVFLFVTDFQISFTSVLFKFFFCLAFFSFHKDKYATKH